METLSDYKKRIKKVSNKRKVNITNSYGSRDFLSYYRKHRPQDSKYAIKDIEFDKIIRRFNEILVENFLKGEDIILPCRMGKIVLYKKPSILKGKKYGGIDWNRTLQLWYEDSELENEKFLLKQDKKWLLKIKYLKAYAIYKNKQYICFQPSRYIKLKVRELFNNRQLDAYKI